MRAFRAGERYYWEFHDGMVIALRQSGDAHTPRRASEHHGVRRRQSRTLFAKLL
jgi:hypothetical protein